MISIIDIAFFNSNVALVVPKTSMVLGNLKFLILTTVYGSYYADYEFLELSCVFMT